MKVGLGVISYSRPKHLNLWREQIIKYTPADYELSIYIDEPRKGIAYGKNQNLKDLAHCDYIFLMDSDCFPIKTGFTEFFIQASKASRQQHFQYLKETPTIKKTGNWTNFTTNATYINKYNNTAGCLMFFTKESIEKVGAYDERFGLYGFEHCQYSDRIHKAGLTNLGAYTCPAGAEKYIYSMDLQNNLPFNKQLNHKSSIGVKEGLDSIQKNKEIYLKDTEIYIPL